MTDSITLHRRVRGLLADIEMTPGLYPHCRIIMGPHRDRVGPQTDVWIQVVANDRLDVVTGEPGTGRGGKVFMSSEMIDSEIVQIAFGLVMRYFEHEVREHFHYKARAVYGPHIDVEALHTAAAHIAVRP